MTFPHHLVVMTGATSVILVQLLSSSGPSLDHLFRGSIIIPPALASTPPKARLKLRYVPPRRRPPTSTQVTGSRGCYESGPSQPVSLTLLVPNDHDGLTTSGHPTFFWHVSTPIPMVFTLTESGVAQPLLEQQIQPQKAGIIQLEMPENLPELLPGRQYRWSVTPLCEAGLPPSVNSYVQVWIERAPAKPELTEQLVSASSEHERALIYAQSGLWYDALAAILEAQTANPMDLSILEDRLLLLEQAGLNQVANQERQRPATWQ